MVRQRDSMCSLRDKPTLSSCIKRGDVEGAKEVLRRFGKVAPMLIEKKVSSGADSACMDVAPLYLSSVHLAVRENQPEILLDLLKFGGDPSSRAEVGMTALHRAARRCNYECVRVLMESEYGSMATLYTMDEWGKFPIHYCAGAITNEAESLRILDYFLEKGKAEDIHLLDEYKREPIHYAAASCNIPMVTRLVELGADLSLKDNSGSTPYDMAQKQPRMREFIRNMKQQQQ